MSRLQHTKDIWKIVQGRSLSVIKSDVDNYRFDHMDFLLASSMLAGCNSITALSEDLGVDREEIRNRLLSPVRCAWLSRELEKGVESRLGQVLAAVYNRAINTGDVNAAKFLYQKFSKFDKPVQQHQHLHMDLSNISEEQLDKLINQKKRTLNYEGKSDEETHDPQ